MLALGGAGRAMYVYFHSRSHLANCIQNDRYSTECNTECCIECSTECSTVVAEKDHSNYKFDSLLIYKLACTFVILEFAQ